MVKDAYLFSDLSKKELTPCYVFGVKATINRPLSFHCQLKNGALFWNLPISAFVHKADFEPMGATEQETLSNQLWWDCQSNDISVIVFAYLQGYTVECRARNRKWYRGRYLFSIDGYHADLNHVPVGYASDTDEKVYHFIELDNGNYCAYPNNYLRWHNLNFCDPYDVANPPRYKPFSLDMKAEWTP